MTKPRFDITDLFRLVASNNASDLHLRVGHLPTVRINGALVPVEVSDQAEEEATATESKTETKARLGTTGEIQSSYRLKAEEVETMLAGVISEDNLAKVREKGQVDYAMNVEGISRFRVNVFKEKGGLAAVFRALPTKMPDIDTLGVPPNVANVFKKLASLNQGLVLVTGATGSGKSTTLAAMVNYINQNADEHILTIEDPIEFVHHPKKSMISQREVGTHVDTFANGIRGALREDPDVILIGEMRDVESIKIALTAAETGHLVFATLHSKSAEETVHRIVNVFPEKEQQHVRTTLAATIAGVISQRLIPRIDKPGRIAAHEIMIGSKAVRNLIRDDKMHQAQTAIETGHKSGMVTMQKSIEALVTQKIITNPADDIDFDSVVTLDQPAPQ